MKVIIISLAPVFIVAYYIYIRDKYEKEPFRFLLKALLAGAIITLPIIFIERFLMLFSGQFSHYMGAGYDAFIVASLTEEVFKFLAFMIIIWNNENFNEKFDGIVYALPQCLPTLYLESVWDFTWDWQNSTLKYEKIISGSHY